jgi:TPP-dependent pyruvate/acetoin dehydrogenase alpha subunit
MLPGSPFKEDRDRPGWNTDAVLRDYRIGCRSRQCSVVARKEVFSGKAKFGIFGEGKEVAQLAMAYAFRKGDFRSGYYRDQTLMLALGVLTPQQFFAQLYAHADAGAEPATGGRLMTSHFATRLLDDQGRFLGLTDRYNSASDVSPTAAQMPRLVGLAYASKLYRELPELGPQAASFSVNGNEAVWGTIGEASCAEGLFWESVNAIGVLQVPAIISIWDDGFGISVPSSFQTTKGDIGRILEGFGRRVGGRPGIALHVVRGWDYPALCSTYLDASQQVRRTHTPAVVHVMELTQPAGHSTSGNHERYKSEERLAWERDYDCLPRMRQWILERNMASSEALDQIEAEEKQTVLDARSRAWSEYRTPIESERQTVVSLMTDLAARSSDAERIRDAAAALQGLQTPLRRQIMAAVADVLLTRRHDPPQATSPLRQWKRDEEETNRRRYGSDLYSESAESALARPVVPVRYSPTPPMLPGFEIMRACFDAA